MNDRKIEERYRLAREQYAELGVDTEAALAALRRVPLSVHCWQGDDVGGFETASDGTLSGGIAATGNYPGKARTMAELRQDLEQLWKLLPGKHRLALHMSYGDFGGKRVDRDAVEPRHFDSWLAWAASCGVKLDMNGTFFSHPKAASGLTLASKDEAVRRFWVEHARRTRAVSAHIGRRQGDACIDNLWIPDGMKDATADRAGYRRQLVKSLDEIFATAYPAAETRDALEGKLFGIGSETFVVGSHELYLAYAAKHGLMVTLDSGHYHPTESIADKISALLLFFDELMVHHLAGRAVGQRSRGGAERRVPGDPRGSGALGPHGPGAPRPRLLRREHQPDRGVDRGCAQRAEGHPARAPRAAGEARCLRGGRGLLREDAAAGAGEDDALRGRVGPPLPAAGAPAESEVLGRVGEYDAAVTRRRG